MPKQLKLSLSHFRSSLLYLYYKNHIFIMGRTQPSLTNSIDIELSKLNKIAEKLRDEELADIIRNSKLYARKIQEAAQDELIDPLEVIMLAILMSSRLRNRRDT